MTHLSANVDPDLEPLTARDYVSDRGLATAVSLALKLGRPLFLEGEAGVKQTGSPGAEQRDSASRSWTPVLRGLDTAAAVYVELSADDRDPPCGETANNVARGRSSRHIHPRVPAEARAPGAIDPDDGIAPVLLIDRLDRAQALRGRICSVLSDFKLSIPELGVIRAKTRPWS